MQKCFFLFFIYLFFKQCKIIQPIALHKNSVENQDVSRLSARAPVHWNYSQPQPTGNQYYKYCMIDRPASQLVLNDAESDMKNYADKESDIRPSRRLQRISPAEVIVHSYHMLLIQSIPTALTLISFTLLSLVYKVLNMPNHFRSNYFRACNVLR